LNGSRACGRGRHGRGVIACLLALRTGVRAALWPGRRALPRPCAPAAAAAEGAS
jgi:hypothetical protein